MVALSLPHNSQGRLQLPELMSPILKENTKSSLIFSQTAVVELSQVPASPLTFQLAPFLSGPQERFPTRAADLFSLQSIPLNLGSEKKKTNVLQGLPYMCSQMTAKAEAQPELAPRNRGGHLGCARPHSALWAWLPGVFHPLDPFRAEERRVADTGKQGQGSSLDTNWGADHKLPSPTRLSQQ